MNRIDSLFGNDPHGLLSVYFCAGFPTLESAPSIIRTLERNGVNMIEIGIPFSDPMADGPVIQNASCMALRNGMSLKLLFSQLADIRKDVKIPLLFMGYLNPIYRYGFENFCRSCKECGIDGAIIPDLPFRDYENEYKEIADRYDIRIIMLITPETSDERIRSIDSNTNGFIYMVSSASTTGAQKDFNDKKTEYFKHVASLNLKNPRMVGFGISNKQTFDSACSNAAGGIIGSHFLTLLGNCENPEKAIEQLRSDIGF
ncbi:MAG: tryptophan synthase subunit alpha [Bacteroidales bacterium]|jgi:tryptophan synthase alpha chain|nr:tryptophan synthase subunit alpha [Bacteroidales bacterium]MCI1785918.1 tryptophan synthase subunit alpha [Bacteroidales bacterium]